MAQENQHLTTEQLSALLDGEVSAEERVQWEAHLATCQRCQQELASLRRMVTLLHALPQPALPRSFELPVETPQPVAFARASRQASEPTPLRATERRSQRKSYLRPAFRTLSALAAMIGIIFVLSGLVPALLQNHGSSSSTASSGAASNGAQSQATPANTPHVISGMTPSARPATEPPAVKNPLPNKPAPQLDTSTWPIFLFFNLSTPEGRLGLGLLLIILGIMGYILFRRQRVRAP